LTKPAVHYHPHGRLTEWWRRPSLRYLQVLSYLEDRRLGRAFLPVDAAGVYWFVRDLVPMLKVGDEQMLDDWLERPRRWFAGEVSPYFKLRVSNSVRRLGAVKTNHLRELTEKVGANTLSAPLLLTQRPLYIGESRKLQKRISDHIEGRTELRELLAAAGLSP
jgi:hypothetical protein